MSKIVGKWTLTSSDKFDDFLRAAGVGMIQRNIASKANPTLEYIIKEDGRWIQRTITSFKNIELIFTPGEEFQENLPDGRISKSLIIIEDNKLTHFQNTGTSKSETTRVFNGKEMITEFKCGTVVATRTFKKLKY